MDEGDCPLGIPRIRGRSETKDQWCIGGRFEVVAKHSVVDPGLQHVGEELHDPVFVSSEYLPSLGREACSQGRRILVAVSVGVNDGSENDVELCVWVRLLEHLSLEVIVVGSDEFGDSDKDGVDIGVIAVERLA